MAGGRARNRAASQTLTPAAEKRRHAGRLVSWQRWPALGQPCSPSTLARCMLNSCFLSLGTMLTGILGHGARWEAPA